jgi:hypothetical protein
VVCDGLFASIDHGVTSDSFPEILPGQDRDARRPAEKPFCGPAINA